MIDINIHNVKRIEVTEPEKHYLGANNKNPYHTRRIKIFLDEKEYANFTLFSYTKDELKFRKEK